MQKRVGVNAHGRELQLRLERAAVERFDVDQLVREFIIARVDAPLGQRIEHERIVRIGAMADADQLLGCGHGANSSR